MARIRDVLISKNLKDIVRNYKTDFTKGKSILWNDFLSARRSAPEVALNSVVFSGVGFVGGISLGLSIAMVQTVLTHTPVNPLEMIIPGFVGIPLGWAEYPARIGRYTRRMQNRIS